MAKKEYIEREALMAYPIRINHYDRENGKLDFVLGVESVMEYAENLPAADVVEVVRCFECKHYGWEQEPNHGRSERFCKLHKGLALVNRDTFCSYGERKEGAE